MIWAILAILGIPIWLLLGALAGAFASRRHFQRSPGVFALRMREVSAEKQKWGGKASARWIHDVLLVNKGIAQARTVPIAVESLVSGPEPADASTIKGLGDQPVAFVVAIDDGPRLEIATATELALVATSPFDVMSDPQGAP
jgi:hypothetical protein